MDDWHVHRVRAWARHGVVLDGEWWELNLTGGMSADVMRRVHARLRSGRPVVPAVTEEGGVFRFPHGHPERGLRGQVNPRFLDPAVTAGRLGPLVRAAGEGIRMLTVRVPHIPSTEGYSLERFLEQLDPWLEALPAGVQYAIDVGTPGFLVPPLLDRLRHHAVAPVLSPGEGTVLDRLQIPGLLEAGGLVVRAEGESAEMVLALVEAVRRCVERQCPLVVCPAPDARNTVAAAAALLDADLAGKSPLRRRAA